MVLFQANQLPSGPSEDEFIIEFVVLRRRSIIEHIDTRQVVLVREFMIDSGGKVIFGGNCRPRKAVNSYVLRDWTVGQWVESQIGLYQGIHRHIPSAQLAIASGDRRYVVDHAQPERLSQPFVVTEDKRLVLLDGASRGRPELVAVEGGDGGPVKIVPRIERAVAQELIGASMEIVGAGTVDSADHAARRPPILGRLIHG